MVATTADGDKLSFMMRLLLWREKHISNKQFILILSLFVGIFTALAAILLKYLIGLVKKLLTSGFDVTGLNFLYLLYPAIGIFLTMLFIRYVVKDDIGHGVTKVLYAISRRKGRIKQHNIWSSLVSSAVTIGFGGSVGAESPIVLTGAAIGSNLGSLFKMEHRVLLLMVGCGAAGAVAGIFKAPIAGLVFTLEVLMYDMTMTSLLPLLISSVTAATVSYAFTGTQAMFHFQLDNAFIMERIPEVIVLGLLCGLVSLYFTHAMIFTENIFRKIKNNYTKFAIGGLTLSILIFFFPPLYGEGYDTIELIINSNGPQAWGSLMNNSLFYGSGSLLLIYLLLIILVKVFASSATNGGGGCGGIFAPTLFLGCLVGFVFAHLGNQLGIFDMPEKNFALFGMAGLMSGIFHAPLTGVFLIAELTGGYDLFLPLMISSAISYLVVRMVDKNNIYAMRLASRGELITHHKDQAVLTLMSTDKVIENDFLEVRPDMDLGQLVQIVSRSRRNLFPVLNDGGKLLGVVQLDDIRNIMFRQELYHRFTVAKLMNAPRARLNVQDSMEVVMHKFDETGAWNLPVEDAEGHYMGFVSKSKIFNTYRGVLLDLSSE